MSTWLEVPTGHVHACSLQSHSFLSWMRTAIFSTCITLATSLKTKERKDQILAMHWEPHGEPDEESSTKQVQIQGHVNSFLH